MTLLTVTKWGQTQDGRWYKWASTEYYLEPARVRAHYLLYRDPQKVEELGINYHEDEAPPIDPVNKKWFLKLYRYLTIPQPNDGWGHR